MGSTGLGGTPWTALTIRAPPVLTKKERHPLCTNSPVFKTILTERPRAAVFLRLFRNNLLPFDPDFIMLPAELQLSLSKCSKRAVGENLIHGLVYRICCETLARLYVPLMFKSFALCRPPAV